MYCVIGMERISFCDHEDFMLIEVRLKNYDLEFRL